MDSWSAFRHVPYVFAGEADECSRLDGTGAPGERIALSFDLASFDGSVDATISPTSLVHQRDVIAASEIDVRVVSVRDHAGLGVYRAARVAAPELLLKDEPVHPTGRYSPFCGHLRHLHRLRPRRRYYQAPDLRLSGAAVTSIGPSQRKQVWITVRLSRTLAPGVYTGAVNIVDRRQESPHGIPLVVEVLDLALREPWQRRMLWFRGSLDCARPQFYLGEEQFAWQLLDIRDHGFNAVSIGEPTLQSLRRALAIARDVGFESVVLQPPYPPDLRREDLEPFDAICYISDEIDQRGPAWFELHRQHVREADALGLPCMSSLVRERFTTQLSALGLGRRPDLVSVYLPSNVDFFKTAAAFPEMLNRDTLYYWMANMEKPNVHRVLAGFYLWKSRAAGISPYCYQHLPRYPFLPYDDFDEWEPGSSVGAETAPVKDQLATYPSRTGSVPTLQWEGLGEGLTDLRYLATVEHLLERARECRDATVDHIRTEAERHLRAISDAVPLSPIQIADDIEAEPYAHLGARDYARFRRTLADDAVALSRAVAAATGGRETAASTP